MPKCPFCEKPIPLGTTSCPYCGAPITSMQPPTSDDLEKRVQGLSDDGQKIAAIKAYREETGAGLLDAKNAVEALEAGKGLHVPERNVPEGFEGDLLRLLSEGKKIQAIKIYRERMGGGLKEAKEAVEALGVQHGVVSRGSGCLGVAFVLAVVVIALIMVAGSWAAADEVTTISAARKDDYGFLVHEVESEFQAGKTLIRVLRRDELQEGHRYPVIYILPVEAGTANRFGDGLIEVKKHDLHNKHGVIFVAPTFSQWPWYADHPTDKAISQESYFIGVVLPFIEKTYPVQASADGRLLLGFSKSGWGAWSLLLRHPDVFGRAAAWDAPMMMDRLGPYGTSAIFGDEDNFKACRIADRLRANGKTLGDDERLILTGYGIFHQDHVRVHTLLNELKIPHEYRDGPQRKHEWHSGWLVEAVALLIGKAENTP